MDDQNNQNQGNDTLKKVAVGAAVVGAGVAAAAALSNPDVRERLDKEFNELKSRIEESDQFQDLKGRLEEVNAKMMEARNATADKADELVAKAQELIEQLRGEIEARK